MLGGYAGKLLRVNLTTGTCENELLEDEGLLRKYLGGIGLGMRIIMDETRADMKATDADAPFMMMNGPLAGTSAPSSSIAFPLASLTYSLRSWRKIYLTSFDIVFFVNGSNWNLR